MIGIYVWMILIVVMMTMIMPEIWIVILLSCVAYGLIWLGCYLIKEKFILPYIKKIKEKRKIKRMAKGCYKLTLDDYLEIEKAKDAWEEKWGRTHPTRINMKR